jgi:hypothetical protein
VLIPEMGDTMRKTLVFRAHKAATYMRRDSLALWDTAIREFQTGDGPMPDKEAILEEAKHQGIPQSVIERKFKPPGAAKEFDAEGKATLMTKIANYDPSTDNAFVDRTNIESEIYGLHLPAQAQTELLERLKHKGDPKDPINSPVAKDAIGAINQSFKIGLYGKFSQNVGYTFDGKRAGPGENAAEVRKEINPEVYARAKEEQMRNLDAVNAWLKENPAATREQAFKFVSGLHETAIATQGARVFGTPARPAATLPTSQDVDQLLKDIGYTPKGVKK